MGGQTGGWDLPQDPPSAFTEPPLLPGHPPEFPDPLPTFPATPPYSHPHFYSHFIFPNSFSFCFPTPPHVPGHPPFIPRLPLQILRIPSAFWVPPLQYFGAPSHLLEAFAGELFQPGPVLALPPLVLEPLPLLLQGGGHAPPGKAKNEPGTPPGRGEGEGCPPQKGQSTGFIPSPALGGFMPHHE